MSKDLEFETNDEGEMVDAEGETIYCENLCCESPATERVVVSVNKPHDEIRNYCDGCQAVYMIGVQHGRFHEAARHHDKPGRGSSQDPPQPK